LVFWVRNLKPVLFQKGIDHFVENHFVEGHKFYRKYGG
jgi:hypothetical protein